ncbi:MAG: MBL fold metallo-hydrolase [Clostridia bacterium]|nr:MBL fold metallo-hydrolase [Clostridia bacterium]
MHALTITDVRAHPGDSAFLIDDGTTAILYDSGFAFTGYAVADNIKKELGSRKLDYIFLTHSHYDHVLGSVYALQYWPETQVVAGEYAVKIFQKESAKRVMRELDRKFAVQCGATAYEDLIDQLKVDIIVRDGDIIQAGAMTFTVLELPGHTRCSIGFYLPENKLLLSSETLGVFDGEETVIPSYLIGYQVTLNSIQKAEQLEIEALLLPHYGLLNREQTAFYLQNAKKNAIETAAEILEILQQGGSHADAFAFFKKKYYCGKVPEIYPIDAMILNTNIMIDLIDRELNQKNS